MKGNYKRSNVNRTYRIPNEVVEKFEMVTMDPMAGRAAYSMKSVIVARLIEKFLEAYAQQSATIRVDDLIALTKTNTLGD